MTKLQDIRRLQTLAQLMLDHRLTLLKQAADAKHISERALAGLSEAQPETQELVGTASNLVGLNYQRWADCRRSELNQKLALQTYDWLEARDAARMALGKAEAISKLTTKLRK